MIHQVTKEVEFDYAHRIPQHDSACRWLHGHRGKVRVTVTGPLTLGGAKDGMVRDFKFIKEALMECVHSKFDHRCVLYAQDDFLWLLKQNACTSLTNAASLLGAEYFFENVGWIQTLPAVPTAENLAFYCFQMLSDKLNSAEHETKPGLEITKNVVCVTKVEFWETPSSCAVIELPYPEAYYEWEEQKANLGKTVGVKA